MVKGKNYGGSSEEHGAGSIPVVAAGYAVVNENGEEPARTLVAASETVPAKVSWEPENRTFHDKWWGVLYVLAVITYLSTGFFLVAKAESRYQRDPVTDVRFVSNQFYNDVNTCCINKRYPGEFEYDLCVELDSDTANQRRLEGSNSTSRYEQGDGIFDAFIEAPEIVSILSITALVLALSWVVLLRFFATPIVFATEFLKVSFFIYLCVAASMEGATGSAIIAILIAIGIVAWDVWTYKKLIFAGKIMSHSAVAFKENPSMFFGFIPICVLYGLNAFLFVLFFSKSFDNVEVVASDVCYSSSSFMNDGFNEGGETVEEECSSYCEFQSPAYATRIIIFTCLAYLWSILFFNTMRLSVIANVIGSWHFHPDSKPGVIRSVINTCTTSLGTISVSSLISTIADKLNRMFLESVWKSCCNPCFIVTMPAYLLLCICGSCIKMLILMLTKFALILHVFTGQAFVPSAKKVFKIMKRHFKGGFVTEYAATSVLNLGSYVFSIAIFLIAWVWFDKAFKTSTFPGASEDMFIIIIWSIFALFNLWYPVLGLYIIILVNRWMAKDSDLDPETWVSPLAAIFVGCIAMMFFTYIASVFLDTINVLFLCFAIDKDNNVDMTQDEFAKLVEEVPGYVKASNVDQESLVVAHGVELVPSERMSRK
eukprot:CAMPEP_0198282040 /NCGR_PEP_ID=MMETSP1449-20131203/1904_1 /TAXON_ID=420275 /ORGANISM="Attheya septentrionalis, Strain CCMP2084" /LENGTH=653 /DNA_ID=CAMNT_0043978111 /DNA_START=139 /DNA_END=2100 /DNA_ORIENTATION=-